MKRGSDLSASRTRHAAHPVFSPWYLLLLLPFIALLWPAFYSRAEPAVWGIPYFYFYQFVWLIIGVILTALVYKVTQREGGR